MPRIKVYATNGEAGGIAGNNNSGASIENVQVSAAVTAANGTAGGVTATNFGIIGQDSGLEKNSSVSSCTITGTSERHRRPLRRTTARARPSAM